MSLVDTISAMKVQPWNRLTMADGQWLQEKTVQQLDERDIELAKAIDELSGGSGPTYSEWVTSDAGTEVDISAGDGNKNFYHGYKYKLNGAGSTVRASNTSGFTLYDCNLAIANCSGHWSPSYLNYVNGYVADCDLGAATNSYLQVRQDMKLDNISDSVFVGENTSATSVSYSFVDGHHNDLLNMNSVDVFGDYNKLQNVSKFTLLGSNNDISTNTYNDVLVGDNNYLNSGVLNSSIFGLRNRLFTGVENTYVNGDDNVLNNNVTHSFVVGKENVGHNGVHYSFINGEENFFAMTVFNTFCTGKKNYLSNHANKMYVNGDENYLFNVDSGIIVGDNNAASGNGGELTHFAGLGTNLHIKGGWSYAAGENISAYGSSRAGYSVNVGKNIRQNNMFQFNLGEDLLTDKSYVVNVGKNNISQGSYELTVGDNNKNYKTNAAEIGTGLENYHDNSLVIGQYNVRYTDSILEIGYGTSDSDRKTIFRVDSSGGVWYAGGLHQMT